MLSLIGLAIIFLALSFTLIRVAIIYVPDYKVSIEEAVSEHLDVRLEIGSVDAEIYWLVPRLNLIDINIHDREGKKHLIHVNEIDLSLDWINTLKNRTLSINEVAIDGLNVKVGVNRKNQLIVQDIVVNEDIDAAVSSDTPLQLSDELKDLINNFNFKITNSNVWLFDERNKQHNKKLKNFSLRLVSSGEKHKFEIKTDLPKKYGRNAVIIVEARGDLFDHQNLKGKVYLQLGDVNIAPWLNDYWQGGALAVNAGVNAEVWFDWEGQEITGAQSRFLLKDVAVHYLDDKVNTWSLKQLQGVVQWLRKDDGWQVDIRDMRSLRPGETEMKPTAISLEMSDLDREIKLKADFLRIESLSYLAGMIFSLDDSQAEVDWLGLLDRHRPSGNLYNIDVVLPLDKPEAVRINTEFDSLGFLLPKMEPARLNNLRGSIIYYGSETWLAMESDNVRLEFDKLFRNSIDLTSLSGVLKFSYQDEHLMLHGDSIYAKTPHISTENRLALRFNDDGVLMDLTTLYRDGDAKYISQYLPAGIMDKATLAWLDRGIVSGRITDGGYQFYGKIKDFPFARNEGVSLADFSVKNVRLDYLEGWPAIDNISAHLRFENASMDIRANSGTIFDSRIRYADVSIASFASPILDIKGDIDANLEDVPRYLLESGLKSWIPGYVSNIKLAGKGKLGLELFVPLSGQGATEWGGKLQMSKASLKLVREQFQFNDLDGEVRFADGLFEIPELNASLDGEPLKLKLSTSRVDDVFTYSFNAQGNLRAKSILAPLKDYQKYLSGKSDWNINIDIFAAREAMDTILDINLSSDLHGVTSTFPGPLSKTRDERLPMKLVMRLNRDENMKYNLYLADDRKISLRERTDKWLMFVDAPSIKGQAVFSKNKTTPVNIDLSYFDIEQFMRSEVKAASNDNADSETGALATDLPPIHFKSRQLKWKTFKFDTVVVETSQARSGLVLEKFKLIANSYQAEGKGYWNTGWNRNHSTALEASIKIGNLGASLKEMGLTDGLDGGKGQIKLNWSWPSAPQGFSWDILKGTGEVDIKDGTIKQIDVGAARMLGIFSLKTFLSLDFANQFSSGFYFDSAKGHVRFADGNAYTQDFSIESKVADLYMNGKVDIHNRRVDQKVRIRPHLSSTMTLGSAVIAGPSVGGIVYLFQKIFDPDKLSEYEYSVKGDINDPKVELVSAPESEQQVQEDEFDTDF